MLSLQLDASLLEKTFAILFYPKALATKHRASSSKSLLFLALACLKNLELSSEELLALVILQQLLGAPSNSAQSLLTLMPVSLSYSYATALLRA
ncbi:hypothetical protein HBI42_065080 [Parastagonospora nodorum]|nr:hypothetical protein HBI42_065080 [Parastagonospora nodorum]